MTPILLGRLFVGPAERLGLQADLKFGFEGFVEARFAEGNLGAGGAAKGGDGGSILGLPEPAPPLAGRNLAMGSFEVEPGWRGVLRPAWAAADDQE